MAACIEGVGGTIQALAPSFEGGAGAGDGFPAAFLYRAGVLAQPVGEVIETALPFTGLGLAFVGLALAQVRRRLSRVGSLVAVVGLLLAFVGLARAQVRRRLSRVGSLVAVVGLLVGLACVHHVHDRPVVQVRVSHTTW